MILNIRQNWLGVMNNLRTDLLWSDLRFVISVLSLLFCKGYEIFTLMKLYLSVAGDVERISVYVRLELN